MSTSYALRERVTESERKQRKSTENKERSRDGMDGNDRDGRRTKKMGGQGSKYDPQGIHKESQKDLCDCLTEDCPGCFFPCKKCSSNKCGHECRRNRRWMYDAVEIEGTSIAIKNPYKK